MNATMLNDSTVSLHHSPDPLIADIAFRVIGGNAVLIRHDLSEGEYDGVCFQQGEQRSLTQNNSLHLFFTWVSNALNRAKKSVGETIRADMPWSPTLVKYVLWGKTQRAAVGKGRSSSLGEEAFRNVLMLFRYMLAVKFGVDVPFPDNVTEIDAFRPSDGSFDISVRVEGGKVFFGRHALSDGEYYAQCYRKGEERPLSRDDKLHLFFIWVSNALNQSGQSVSETIRVDMEWTPDLVKHILWAKTQKATIGSEGTSSLKLHELGAVLEVFQYLLSSKIGLYVPFPDKNKKQAAA